MTVDRRSPFATLERRVKLLRSCNTADDVAAQLHLANARGLRFSAQVCPLATFLKSNESHVEVTVRRRYACVRRRDYPERYEVLLPPAAQVFVSAFDRGAYPELGIDRR